MTEQEFFTRVQETLELDQPVDRQTSLEDLEEFDSLGILNLMTLFDELGIDADQSDFADAKIGADLLNMASDAVDG